LLGAGLAGIHRPSLRVIAAIADLTNISPVSRL
jgi:hypothetical protein